MKWIPFNLFLGLLLGTLPVLAQKKITPFPVMVEIKGGNFTMGDTAWTNTLPHEVIVNDFSIGKYEVTFDEYDLFCSKTKRTKPHDSSWGRGQRPVININFYDAIEYCNWLSKEHKLIPYYTITKNKKDINNLNTQDPDKWIITIIPTANGFRLPTEAEWEFAARDGGKPISYPWGNEKPDGTQLNWAGKGKDDGYENTAPVGQYMKNTNSKYQRTYDLADLAGNVWEFCWDWYAEDYYAKSLDSNNPLGAEKGYFKVLRGGSWLYPDPEIFRTAARDNNPPHTRYYNVGFRLVLTGAIPIHK